MVNGNGKGVSTFVGQKKAVRLKHVVSTVLLALPTKTWTTLTPIQSVIAHFQRTRIAWVEGCLAPGKTFYLGGILPRFHLIFCVTGDQVTLDKGSEIGIPATEIGLDIPDVGSWVVVEVTALVDPGKFFVTFPYGTSPLPELLTETDPEDSLDGTCFCVRVSRDVQFFAMLEIFSSFHSQRPYLQRQPKVCLVAFQRDTSRAAQWPQQRPSTRCTKE